MVRRSDAKSGAKEPACFSRFVPAVLESTLHVRLAPRGLVREEVGRNLVKNAQRSKTVKVLSSGYANESSGASIKARFQKSGSS
jgi:hypothetical protein